MLSEIGSSTVNLSLVCRFDTKGQIKLRETRNEWGLWNLVTKSWTKGSKDHRNSSVLSKRVRQLESSCFRNTVNGAASSTSELRSGLNSPDYFIIADRIHTTTRAYPPSSGKARTTPLFLPPWYFPSTIFKLHAFLVLFSLVPLNETGTVIFLLFTLDRRAGDSWEWNVTGCIVSKMLNTQYRREDRKYE